MYKKKKDEDIVRSSRNKNLKLTQVDTYSNCAHQCLYCFSFFQRAVGESAEAYLSHKVKSVDVRRIKKMFSDPDNYAGQFAPYIKRRMVMQWGGLSDGFDWYEKKFGVSLELLKFFREIDYPVSISTKGTWFVDDPIYRDVLKDAKNVHFKYSIITTNEEHARKIEPGVPTPAERFLAMKKLGDLGIGATTLRFRPFVIGISDLCIDDMMRQGKEANCYSVTTEFLCWESRAANNSRERLRLMSKVCGYDIWEFYRENSSRTAGLMRLNYDLKRPYIGKMAEAAECYGLKFFVSDAHHKEASHGAGCCGLPDTGPLSQINRGQYAEAILIAKKKGFVRWEDIAEDAALILKVIPFYAAEGFPGDTLDRAKRRYMSMYDYMRDMWNNPTSWMSPARYFGGALVPSGKDENGDIIYLYNKPFVESGYRVKTVAELADKLAVPMLTGNVIPASGAPRAEAFDRMTADGTDYAWLSHPIAVFSRGRAQRCTTPQILDKAKLNYVLWVPINEVEEYRTAFPLSEISSLPVEADNIGKAKLYVQNYMRDEKYEYVWFLDDDIDSFRHGGRKVGIRTVLSYAEATVSHYENVAICGFTSTHTGDDKAFGVNKAVSRCVLFNLNTTANFSPYPMMEDIDFILQVMKDRNWCSIMVNSYRIDENEDAAQAGGSSRDWIAGKQKEVVDIMSKKWPEFIKVKEVAPPKYYDIDIDWKQFAHPLQPSSMFKLMEIENGDKYLDEGSL